MASSFDSFGRLDRQARAGRDVQTMWSGVPAAAPGEFLAFGNGRSYGDSCHNDTGCLADFRAMNRVFAFDPQTGVLEAEAGAMLHKIIDVAAPYGWFLPVTPGTRFVTLGGAVANDVHGKNHHWRGTFGCHVLGMELVRSDGRTRWLNASDTPELFGATIGGMGLTGFITRVRVQLMKVGSLDVTEKVTPFRSLGDYFDRAEAADAENEYSVAWLDQLSSVRRMRGVLLTGNHAENGNFDTGDHTARFQVPFELPFNALNPWSLKAFNTAFYLAKRIRAGRVSTSGYGSFFYPLDAVGDWNRLYGPNGLFQHQSAIPFDAARETIPALLDASRKAGEASFLTVLKRFGRVESPGMMSFPLPGYTLTLDFPNRGARTLKLLDELDRITVAAGGRVNPYKDARMSADTFAACFPQWRAFERYRDPSVCSNFWRRTALRLRESGHGGRSVGGFQPALTAAQ